MGWFDNPDRAIKDLHRQAEEAATRAKFAKDPKKAERYRREATRLTKKAAFVRGLRDE
jgi:hypothetical protein